MDPSVVDHVLATIGTFRMDAPIQSDDIRFASLADGLDLSDIGSRQLSDIIRQRCRILHRDDHYRRLWVREW